MLYRLCCLLVCLVLLPSCRVLPPNAPGEASVQVVDLFGRPVGSVPLTLPDWEGYMANPAIRLQIVPPADAAWPLAVTLATNDPLVHFDLPGEVDAAGATKRLVFKDATPQFVHVAAFPRRDKQVYDSVLRIRTSAGSERSIAVRVVPAASGDASPQYPVTVDFSQDRTGFYADPLRQAIFRQAVADWSYYLRDDGAQVVSAGAERTMIWEPDGFKRSRYVMNAQPYRGFLLYSYGIQGEALRAGGEPSTASLQAVKGGTAAPRYPRSGGVETEVRGNYNMLGWMPGPLADRDWWRATNLGDVQNDLYSIVHHEIGHALFFHPGHPGFQRSGVLTVRTLDGRGQVAMATNRSDHFEPGLDPASLHGTFGNEYEGAMPYGRWLITRSDLLAIRELGYALRPVAPLLPLTLRTPALPPAAQGQAYAAAFSAAGGIPVYDWQVVAGSLPPGVALDRHAGTLQGKPEQAGVFRFRVRVREYAEPGAVAESDVALTVR
jgi:hypothetical protein